MGLAQAGRSVDQGRQWRGASVNRASTRRCSPESGLLGPRTILEKASAALAHAALRPLRSGHRCSMRSSATASLTSRLSTSRHTRRAAGTRRQARCDDPSPAAQRLDHGRGCRRGGSGASRAGQEPDVRGLRSRTFNLVDAQFGTPIAVALIHLHGETAGAELVRAGALSSSPAIRATMRKIAASPRCRDGAPVRREAAWRRRAVKVTGNDGSVETERVDHAQRRRAGIDSLTPSSTTSFAGSRPSRCKATRPHTCSPRSATSSDCPT